MGGGRESTAAISPILSLFLLCAPLFGEERSQIYTQAVKSERKRGRWPVRLVRDLRGRLVAARRHRHQSHAQTRSSHCGDLPSMAHREVRHLAHAARDLWRFYTQGWGHPWPRRCLAVHFSLFFVSFYFLISILLLISFVFVFKFKYSLITNIKCIILKKILNMKYMVHYTLYIKYLFSQMKCTTHKKISA